MTVFRRGAQKELTVTVAELEADPQEASAEPAQAPPSQPAAGAKGLGLGVSDLTAAQKKELNVEGGVLVLAAAGAAARAGLREGDVIVAVANTETDSVAQLESALAKVDKSRPLNVLFRRGEWAQYTVIRPNR
jgi:serine protease Do